MALGGFHRWHSRHSRPAACQGVALMLTLFAVAAAVVLSCGFLASQATTSGIARNVDGKNQARAVAETGLTLAIRHMKSDTTWRTTKPHGSWFTGQALLGGTLDITVEDGVDSDGDGIVEGDGDLTDDSNEPVTITATGRYHETSHRVRAVLTATTTNFQVVLMIVPDAASLGATDLARKTILEALGWQVNPLSQSVNQTDFDEALDEATVIYVSSTVTSTSLASKVKDSELGAVIEAGSLWDDLGICSAAATAVSDSMINITNNTHYITTGLSTGSNVLFNSNQPLQRASGSIAAGDVMLAKQVGSGTNRMLDVLEVGSTMHGGGTAEGRRVFLPWGSTALSPSELTDTGKSILERALNWAAGFDEPGSVMTNSIRVNKEVKMKTSAKIDSFRASSGAYSLTNNGSEVVMTVNAKSSNKIDLSNDSTIRGDVAIGVGGATGSVIKLTNNATITGTKTVQSSNAIIPAITTPTDLGSSTGDITYSSGTTTLSSNLHCNKLTLSNSAILQISGHITILADKDVTVQDSAQIKILSSSSLTFYGKKKITFKGTSQGNVNTFAPSKFQIYAKGNKTLSFEGSSSVYATVVGSTRTLTIKDTAHLHGTFIGSKIDMQGSGILSMDATSTAVLAGQGGSSVTYAERWVEEP